MAKPKSPGRKTVEQNEPACDLPAAAVIWSSSQEEKLLLDSVFMGQLGLTGEVRRYLNQNQEVRN